MKHYGPDRDARPWVDVVVLGRRNGDRRLLVGHHKDRGLVFPGGRLNSFEPMLVGAAREFSEETGLTVTGLRQLGVFESIDEKHDYHKIVLAFEGTIEGDDEPEGSDDLKDTVFLDIVELRQRPDVADMTLRIIDTHWP